MAKNFIPIFLGDITADWNVALSWYNEAHPMRNSHPPSLQIDDDPVRLKGQYLGCLISRFQMNSILAQLKEYPRPNIIPAGGDMNYVGWSMELFTRTKNEKRISIYPLDENQATDSRRDEKPKSSDDFIEPFRSYLKIPAGAEKDHRVKHCRVIAQHFGVSLIAEIPEENRDTALAMLEGEESLYGLLPVTQFGNPYPTSYVPAGDENKAPDSERDEKPKSSDDLGMPMQYLHERLREIEPGDVTWYETHASPMTSAFPRTISVRCHNVVGVARVARKLAHMPEPKSVHHLTNTDGPKLELSWDYTVFKAAAWRAIHEISPAYEHVSTPHDMHPNWVEKRWLEPDDDGLTIPEPRLKGVDTPEFHPMEIKGGRELLAALEDAKTKIAKAFRISLKDMT